MDITSFVTSNRDRAFLIGDYNTYRSQLTRQLLGLRKKLGRTTPKNAKYAAKAPVTAADVGGNHDFVRLILMQAERAWAQAMHMKTTHAEDNATKGIAGPTRKHIISRLFKASRHASELVNLLHDREATGATDADFLEAQAYADCLAGAEEFEKQSSHRHEDPKAAWKQCLTSFSEAHVIYTALLYSTQKDVYKEVIAGTVDPSIRYAAYQSRLPRTIPISAVAKQYFRRTQSELVARVEKQNPTAFQDDKAATTTSKDGTSSTAQIPTTVTWRNRTAPIADAAIGQALAATTLAATHLSNQLSAETAPSNKSLAAAYDPVLTAAQDTVDAVHSAITDLSKEGVPESDPRTQDLRVADLAANHALISWRVGRNRALISSPGTLDDGLDFSAAPAPKPRRAKTPKPSGESKPLQLARLTDRVVLYSSTLQSIDSIKELRGASRDTAFVDSLDAQRAYFQALKCLNVGRSHALLGAHVEALALYSRAADLAAAAAPSEDANHVAPPTLAVKADQLTTLRTHLATLVRRQRGLVCLHQYAAEDAAKAAGSAGAAPLVTRLGEYPAAVDFGGLVAYPPRLEVVPVKPIFLDLAWNFVGYPGREEDARGGGAAEVVGGVVEKVGNVVESVVDRGGDVKEEKRRGWFGFGRG